MPNHRALKPAVVSCLLTRTIHTGQLLAILVWVVKGLLEEKSSNHSTKCSGDFSPYPHETPLKYAGPFPGIVLTLLYLKLAKFCTITDVDKCFSYFFGQNEFFAPVFRTSIVVTETFPISSDPSSHGPGKYVKHRMGSFFCSYMPIF